MSDTLVANATGWAGPWPLATTPLWAIEAIRARDPVALAGVAASGALVARRGGGAPRRTSSGVPFTLYAHNVLGVNRHSARLGAAVAGSGADAAVLVELNDRQVPALERATVGWHHALSASRGLSGVGIVSRHPFEWIEHFSVAWLRGIVVRTAGVAVVGLHLPSPRMHLPDLLSTREQMAAAGDAAAVIRGIEGPLVVAGDLNATRWNHAHRLLLEKGGLMDAVRARTRDWFCTFPAAAPFLRIDHVLARGLDPLWARRLPPTGSDHRALLVGLAMPQDG